MNYALIMVRFLEYFVLFIATLLAQILIFNYIHIGTFANANILLLFVMLLPLELSRYLVLLLSALLGISFDFMTGSAGINTIALTFVGFVRSPLVVLFLGKKENTKRGVITSERLGLNRVLIFISVIAFIQNCIIFTLESLSMVDIIYTAIRIISSSIVSLLFIYMLHLIPYKGIKLNETSGR
ncbi:MAG: hypothetical protein R3Y50_01475 [Rikenellaceae bacterium]